MIFDFLEGKGHKCRTANSWEEDFKKIEEEKPDIVLLDFNILGIDREATLKVLKKRYPDLQVIMATINANRSKTLELITKGAYDYITKFIYFGRLEKYLSVLETLSDK